MDYKDYVVVITGIVVALTGLIALIRGWHLNRLVYREPYFRKKWPQVSGGISRYLGEIRRCTLQFKEAIENEDSDKLYFNIHARKPSLNDIDWTSAKKEKRAIEYSMKLTDTVKKLSIEYSDLRYLTSPKLIQDFEIYMEIDQTLKNNTNNDVELKKQDKVGIDEYRKAVNLAKRYGLSGIENLGKLKNYPVYKHDLNVLKSKIMANIVLVNESLEKATAAVDFLDTKFSNERQ